MSTSTEQTARTAKALYNTIDINTVNSLKTSMVAGSIIYARDVNSLIGMYNTMNTHYHRYDDAYQLTTFGNNGDRNNYYEDKDTSTPVGGAGISTISVGTVATATKHNELAGQSRNLSSHYHSINDRTA